MVRPSSSLGVSPWQHAPAIDEVNRKLALESKDLEEQHELEKLNILKELGEKIVLARKAMRGTQKPVRQGVTDKR